MCVDVFSFIHVLIRKHHTVDSDDRLCLKASNIVSTHLCVDIDLPKLQLVVLLV